MMVKKKMDKDVHFKENWQFKCYKTQISQYHVSPSTKKINTWSKIDLLHGHLVVINYILNRIPCFIWTLGMLEGVQGRVFYYKTMACG